MSAAKRVGHFSYLNSTEESTQPSDKHLDPTKVRRQTGMPLARTAEGEYTYSLHDLFRVLQRRFWLILLVTLVLTGAVIGYTLLQTPTYEASVKILVGQETSSSGPPGSLDGTITGLQKLTDTMSEAVKSSRPIAEAVIDRFDLQTTPESLLGLINARPIRQTQFIQIDYRDSSPETAQQVANGIGEEFVSQVSTVSPNVNGITATVWQEAVVPSTPISPKLGFNIAIALVLGLMLGVVLAFLVNYLDPVDYSGRQKPLIGESRANDQSIPNSYRQNVKSGDAESS